MTLARLRTLLLALAATVPAALGAQGHPLHDEGYLTPPEAIARLVDSSRFEAVQLTLSSPDGRTYLNTVSSGMPTLAQLARPYHRLAGVAVDHGAARARSLTLGTTTGLELVDARTGVRLPVQIPAGTRVSGASWSPDGTRIAFLVHTDREVHLYTADRSNRRAQQLTRTPLLATRVTEVEWSGDSRYLFAVVIPEGRGGEPVAPAAPTTPIVRVNAPAENRLRTYPSLLKTPHDRALLQYHTTGQLVRIEVGSRRVERIGAPAMIESVSVSPSGGHVRVRTTQAPFSYIVPASQFADLDEVWDLSGQALVELAKRPVREGADTDGGGAGANGANNQNGRRALAWRPDGAGLSFLQREPAPARDTTAADSARTEPAPAAGGNNARKDRVMQWLAPFGEENQVVVYESATEIRSVQYSADARWLFLTERVRNTDRLYVVHLDDPTTRIVLAESDSEDFFDAPGTLLTRPGALGSPVVRQSSDGAYVYLSGTEHFENPETEAPRPFIDRVNLRTGEKERIFQSAADRFERVTGILDDDLAELVVVRESPTEVPNAWHLDRATGVFTPLTQNADPHPEVTVARRERITVRRADGFSFKVDVTLPPGYVQGTRLPALFWFYPREFTNQEAYDRTLRTWNRNRFPTVGPRSMEILTAAGYAVIQPDHPIVGPSDRMNDNYITDLKMNHLAVIDALDEAGWIDRRRLALGGHSYGGFGTLNAMVHTPFFRAGIAGAPNSNRLLTPIGFQGERRPLWEAREIYLEMSPFLFAERLNGAVLIYHGEDDQNVGTFPDNSWRLIHGLNGLGKTAALYMYPYEDHGQVARETLLDMWTRWVSWLDHYVKDADVTEPVAPVALPTEGGN